MMGMMPAGANQFAQTANQIQSSPYMGGRLTPQAMQQGWFFNTALSNLVPSAFALGICKGIIFSALLTKREFLGTRFSVFKGVLLNN